MKKFAFFVEGETETLFLKRLISEVFGRDGLTVAITDSISPDESVFSVVRGEVGSECRFYVLIFNSKSDSRVKSDILDRYEQLQRAGHERVVGLLDLYPKPRHELERFREGLGRGFPESGLEVDIFISVMEIEAWFLAEISHFSVIHEDLTLASPRYSRHSIALH